MFYTADKLLVGFESESSTGERLQTILKHRTHDALKEEDSNRLQQQKPAGKQSQSKLLRNAAGLLCAFVAMRTSGAVVFQCSEEVVPESPSAPADEEPRLPT